MSRDRLEPHWYGILSLDEEMQVRTHAPNVLSRRLGDSECGEPVLHAG